jgi:hypothetical protein
MQLVPQQVLFTEQFTWAEKLAYLTHRFNGLVEVPVQERCPVKHIFEAGVYIREMFIPAGLLFIGRPHRHGHRCELVSGSVVHIAENGEVVREAPFEVTTQPGYQMVLRALTDVVGRTYHPNPTESRDEAALELEAFHPIDEMMQLGADVERRAAERLT